MFCKPVHVFKFSVLDNSLTSIEKMSSLYLPQFSGLKIAPALDLNPFCATGSINSAPNMSVMLAEPGPAIYMYIYS